MAYVVEFAIDGLAGRSDQFRCEMNRDINILFGFNGCGKTSILKILTSAMSGSVDGLERVPFTSAKVVIHSDMLDRDFVYTIDMTQDHRQSARIEEILRSTNLSQWSKESISSVPELTGLKPRWQVQPETKDDGPTLWQHRFLSTYRILFGASPVGFDANNHTSLDDVFEAAIQKQWLYTHSTIESQVRKIQQVGISSILSAVMFSDGESDSSNGSGIGSDWKVAYNLVSSFLGYPSLLGPIRIPNELEFQKKYNDSRTLRNVVTKIEKVVQDSDIAMKPRAELESLIRRMFSNGKKIDFTPSSIQVTGSNGKPIGLRSLSSGERQLLTILLEATMAERSTLFIDEPELSLHIDWQRDLIDAIQHINPRAQLILATHSPEIMAKQDDSKIFRV